MKKWNKNGGARRRREIKDQTDKQQFFCFTLLTSPTSSRRRRFDRGHAAPFYAHRQPPQRQASKATTTTYCINLCHAFAIPSVPPRCWSICSATGYHPALLSFPILLTLLHTPRSFSFFFSRFYSSSSTSFPFGATPPPSPIVMNINDDGSL